MECARPLQPWHGKDAWQCPFSLVGASPLLVGSLTRARRVPSGALRRLANRVCQRTEEADRS